MKKRLSITEFDEMSRKGETIYLESLLEDDIFFKYLPNGEMFAKWRGDSEFKIDPTTSNLAGYAIVNRSTISKEVYDKF